MKVQVFDPPMCCSSGVCGPAVDPELVRFAANLDWLKRQGVEVERFNLSQQPSAFVNNPTVKEALAREGNDCLPMTIADGEVICKGYYPNEEALAAMASRSGRVAVFGKGGRTLTVREAQQDGGCCGSAAPSGDKKRSKSGCCG